jgi:hypothetical protein
MCHAISLLCLTFKEPILAIKLQDYQIGITMVGVIFSLDTITYTIMSIGL